MLQRMTTLVNKRALDLFCGAGGASMGLHRAGFDVRGIDIAEQPSYPFDFCCRDALAGSIPADIAFIWASPPCQAFTAYRRRAGHVPEYPNLIPAVREMLDAWGGLYCIENVPGAPLRDPIQLCGSSFGLDVRRHRIFECNFDISAPPCDHSWQTPRFPPATNRKNPRKTVEVGVWRMPLDVQQMAMGIEWMGLRELSQAIPPAYSEFIANEALRSIHHELS